MDFDQIKPSRRADLIIVQRDRDGRAHWIVKDPIQLNYFILDEFQYWIFQRFDGKNSIASIAKKFNDYFSPIRSTVEEVFAVCVQMSRDCLLNETATGDLVEQRLKAKNRGRLWKMPMSLLSIKLPPVNARYFFDVAEAALSWLFSPLAMLVTLVLFAFSGILLFQHVEVFVAEIPKLAHLQSTDILSFLLALSLVKVLHELGHAISCRRLGAECNELGLMFLVFSPCLYCDVSDSWMFPQRWKRIAVVSAGIYVELVIAAIALILWHNCEVAFLRAFFLNIVLICSFNTLLVNGNPLMRYDGYFILSDVVGIHNLSSQARNTTWNLICSLLFRTRAKENDFNGPGTRAFLVTYYVLSVAYRWFIMLAIFWMVYTFLKSYGLENAGLGLAAAYATMTLLAFGFAFAGFVRRKNRQEKKRWWGILAALGILIAAGWFVFRIEIPQRVDAAAVVEFEDYSFCNVPVSGILTWAMEPNQQVKQGEVIARLENDDLNKSLRLLEHRQKLLKIQIDHLESRGSVDQDSQFELPELKAQLADVINQQTQTKNRIKRLEILAPATGQILALPVQQSSDANWELPGLDGTVLDPKNRGCFVEEGTPLCMIANPQQKKLVLLIDERRLDLVQEGDRVEILLPTSGQTLSATIAGFSIDSLKHPDSTQIPGAQIGRRQVKAMLELDEPLQHSFHDVRGKANILVGRETVGQMVRRFFIETFRFDL